MGGCQVSHRDLPSVLDHTEGKREVHRNSHLSQKPIAVYAHSHVRWAKNSPVSVFILDVGHKTFFPMRRLHLCAGKSKK